MNTLRLLAFALAACVAQLSAAAATLSIHLPADVPLLGIEHQAGATELKLAGAALQHRIALPPLAALRVEGGACLVRIPFAGDPPAFQVFPAADAAIAIRLATDDAPAPAPASSPISAAAPPAPTTIVRPATAPGTFAAPTWSPAPAGPPPTVGAMPPSLAAPAPAAPPPPTVVSAAPAPIVAPPTPGADPTLAGTLAEIFPAGPIAFDPVAKADYAIPDSPAAAALGGTTGLLRPATPRQLVTSLLTHFDEQGRLQSGFSVAITPYTMLRTRPLLAEEYERSATERFLANLQLSLAGKPDPALAPNAIRASAGVSMVFFDAGDLRRDRTLLGQINALLARPGGFSDDDITGRTTTAPLPAANLANAAQLWAAKKAANWNKASAGLGLAPLFYSASGQPNDLKGDGTAVWLSWAQPGPGTLAQNTQFVLGGTALLNQRMASGTTFVRTDTVDLGTQIRFGSAEFNGFAEALYRRRTPAAGGSTSDIVYELGLEKKLQSGLWLNLSWSNDDRLTGGRVIRSGLRYGFGNKAVLANPSP